MIPLRPVTKTPEQSSPSKPASRKFSPEFTRAFTDPEYREKNRLKATTAGLAENKNLTWKQKRFISELLADPERNLSQAALRAGYSREDQGLWLSRHPQIAPILEEAKQAQLAQYEITEERVLAEIAKLAFFNLGEMICENVAKPGTYGIDPTKLSSEQKAALKEVLPDKLVFYDKLTALQLLGKYLKLWEDKQTFNQQFNTIAYFDNLLTSGGAR